MSLNEVVQAVERLVDANTTLVKIMHNLETRIETLEKEVASLKADYIG